MDLSDLLANLQQQLDLTGWRCVIEDDHPDFKQVVCCKYPGLLDAITRLDLLVMTPELDPADASGICLCFHFYADPAKVLDMRKLGKLIRQDDFMSLQQVCFSALQGSLLQSYFPSVIIKTRPKFEKIRFDNDRYDYPAFFIELGYWLPN